MNQLNRFIEAVRSARGADVSLRSVFPGRGRVPTRDRAGILAHFAKEGDVVQGVMRDRRRGVFYAVQAKAEAV